MDLLQWCFCIKDDIKETFSAAVSKTGKQSTLQFKPVDKKPKKNPWSEDEAAPSDNEVEAVEVVAPKERVERKTKGEPARWPRLLSSLIVRQEHPLFTIVNSSLTQTARQDVITPEMFGFLN